MRTEHGESFRERLGDACVLIVELLIAGALLMPGWI